MQSQGSFYCSVCTADASGRCSAGSCVTDLAVVSTACLAADCAGSIDARPSCMSALCQTNCTLGLVASTILTSQQVCKISQQPCGEDGLGRQCSALGDCIIPPPLSDLNNGTNNGNNNLADSANTTLIGAVVGAIAAVLLIALIVTIVVLRRRRQQRNSSTPEVEMTEDIKSLFNIKGSELEYISKLGEGSFGIVYKGKFKGQDVAIKKLAVNTRSSAVADFFRFVRSAKTCQALIFIFGLVWFGSEF